MHTFIIRENHEFKKAKVINKNFVCDEPKQEDYKNVLFNRSYMRHEVKGIQSKDHIIGSHRINKVSLSSYELEKSILKDGYSKLSHFHKSTG